MPTIDRIALSEVRQLKEAQRGNPSAFGALIEPYLPGVWSICLGHSGDEAQALAAALAFREALRGDLPALAPDRPFGVQLYTVLWRTLAAHVEPPPRGGIDRVPAPGRTLRPVGPDDEQRVRKAILETHPYHRLVYLFWLVTELDAGPLADMLDVPETVIRSGRSTVSAAVQEALTT